jgi:hypothetical protein
VTLATFLYCRSDYIALVMSSCHLLSANRFYRKCYLFILYRLAPLFLSASRSLHLFIYLLPHIIHLCLVILLSNPFYQFKALELSSPLYLVPFISNSYIAERPAHILNSLHECVSSESDSIGIIIFKVSINAKCEVPIDADSLWRR